MCRTWATVAGDTVLLGGEGFRFSTSPGIIERVDEAWDQFVMVCQQALGGLVEGRPEPFKALWSHADDVVISAAAVVISSAGRSHS